MFVRPVRSSIFSTCSPETGDYDSLFAEKPRSALKIRENEHVHFANIGCLDRQHLPETGQILYIGWLADATIFARAGALVFL